MKEQCNSAEQYPNHNTTDASCPITISCDFPSLGYDPFPSNLSQQIIRPTNNDMAKNSSNSTSKRKHGTNTQPKDPLKQSRGQSDSNTVEFVTQRQGPLILLHFTTLEAQHQTLARVESFYESASHTRKYITLQDPMTKFLCRNYQAFNLPIIAMNEWLQAMQNSEKALSSGQGSKDPYSLQGWWRSFTNTQESCLLDQLWQIGCLGVLKAGETPSYLISVTNKSATQHELLHALFFLHSGYRDKVNKLWEGLSKKCRLVISHDFLMRGYGEHVWVDEFQAYVSEAGGKFGKKTKQECIEAGVELRAAQILAWQELVLDHGAIC